MRHLAPLGGAALCFAASLSAQPTTASPERILAAVEDCASASTAEGLSEEGLRALGWQEVEVDMTGNPFPGDPTVFGKDRDHPLIRVVFNAEGLSACLVEGWLDEDSDVALLNAELVEKFGSAEVLDGMTTFRFRSSMAMVLPEHQLSNSDFRIIVTGDAR
ncbi:MAG: hypothetical protein KJ901_07310 [Gammaproteobacteria bacterium]|nr:hypothetical protein [Gammaproteobacteria bacterium]